MYPIDQAVVNLMVVVSVISMVPWLGILIATMLMRQIKRFGFSHSWGNEGDYNL